MFYNAIIIHNDKKYSIYYNLKKKLNNKYKKLIRYNRYNKTYNPRQETNVCNKKITIKKNKFYINNNE
ncbi:hypothetical protein TpMuguga_05g00007 (apicoplast) [Theileria parva strain Muguga]|uniref:Uncharacterized protein n=1 Tax=Theileria parva TaxID=5875 RepID=Q4MYB6_THEPA|nr:hypothetical protein TpMuguga_05g00007 [Theileria parva strain Muguga]|eukprot:XP_762676.1 hypothetical protein (apicoplast) [Theileria parva strain Muguga]